MTVKTNKDVMDTSWYFGTPVYSIMKPEWLKPAIKATDKFIDEAYKLKKPDLKERKKFLGNKDYLKVKDHGMSYHSTPLNGDPGLKKSVIKNIQKKRKSDIVWMNDRWIYKEIHPLIHEANAKAGWNFEWDWSESCQFTKYGVGQYYGLH